MKVGMLLRFSRRIAPTTTFAMATARRSFQRVGARTNKSSMKRT
jgi:hypothetical protein